jgi:hypothetical protein
MSKLHTGLYICCNLLAFKSDDKSPLLHYNLTLMAACSFMRT